MSATLRGLVLSGGRSTRMQRDKALLDYAGKSQLERAVELLAAVTPDVRVSVRADQADDPLRSRFVQVVDGPGVQGPAAGILAAQQADPTAVGALQVRQGPVDLSHMGWIEAGCDKGSVDVRRQDATTEPSRLPESFQDGVPDVRLRTSVEIETVAVEPPGQVRVSLEETRVGQRHEVEPRLAERRVGLPEALVSAEVR